MQTALDLLDNGMQPIIITDAVGSRDLYDRKIAIRRVRPRAGAVVTTTEAILFELCRSSEDPAFKTISALVKWVRLRPCRIKRHLMQPLIDYLLALDALKSVNRRNYTTNFRNTRHDVLKIPLEHSWHLAMACWSVAQHFKLDVNHENCSNWHWFMTWVKSKRVTRSYMLINARRRMLMSVSALKNWRWWSAIPFQNC